MASPISAEYTDGVSSRPVVVAVTGHAYAVGGFLVLSGDHCVGVEGASYGRDRVFRTVRNRGSVKRAIAVPGGLLRGNSEVEASHG